MRHGAADELLPSGGSEVTAEITLEWSRQAKAEEFLHLVLTAGSRPGGPSGPRIAGRLVLEVHVFDWNGDLYGRRVRTTFVACLRDELRFDSVEALVAQIQADMSEARTLLARSVQKCVSSA